MKRAVACSIAVLTGILSATAGDFSDFLGNLSSNWTARNYSGVKQTINTRLASKTNDLPALIAKADYYTTVELDMTVVSNVVAAIKVVTNGLNWTVDEEAAVILDEMIISAENRTLCEQAGYIYGLSSNELEQAHQEFPTNHPAAIFLPRYAIVQYGSAD